MHAVEQHVRRRATAAAAAAASEIRPINAKRSASAPPIAARAAPAPAPARAHGPRARTLRRRTESPRLRKRRAAARFWAGPRKASDSTGKASKPPNAPPGPLPRDENGEPSLLQERAGIDADESYGSQEHALSSYLKLHPVLSLESTSCQTLQLVANLVEGTSIPTKELEVVPKPHDDEYLRCKCPV